MKVAIHLNNSSFIKDWVNYCDDYNIFYEFVDCYESDIIEKLRSFDVLLWHHHHGCYKDVLFAKALLISASEMGLKTFPDYNSGWHFDDKVAQKYLLEAISAPIVPSYVFYDKWDALFWAKRTTYPKVFKLRGGAGASNVLLARSYSHAKKLINRSFGKGFNPFNKYSNLKDKLSKFQSGKGSLIDILKGLGRLIITPKMMRLMSLERGYAYFQDFIPENKFDMRVVIISNRAFCIKRLVRENDFRASGSGQLIYDKDEIDVESIRVAFESSKKLRATCLAYDFVYNRDGKPLIVEISYGFSLQAYYSCEGYWTSDLLWHDEEVKPADWIIDLIINQAQLNNSRVK